MGEAMTAHTPGPWKFDNTSGCRPIKAGKHGTHKQAQYRHIAHTDGLFDDEEDKANANLIAAAPELLAALLAVKACGGASGEYCIDCSYQIDDAIAKAKGERLLGAKT